MKSERSPTGCAYMNLNKTIELKIVKRFSKTTIK